MDAVSWGCSLSPCWPPVLGNWRCLLQTVAEMEFSIGPVGCLCLLHIVEFLCSAFHQLLRGDRCGGPQVQLWIYFLSALPGLPLTYFKPLLSVVLPFRHISSWWSLYHYPRDKAFQFSFCWECLHVVSLGGTFTKTEPYRRDKVESLPSGLGVWNEESAALWSGVFPSVNMPLICTLFKMLFLDLTFQNFDCQSHVSWHGSM